MRSLLFILGTALAQAAVSFESEVKPIFEKHCMECHGPKKQKSEFRLDDREVALHGGESHAPNILPGKAAESPLIKFVTTADHDTRMPPKGDRLTAAQVDTLKRWIAEGAVWPESASLKKTDPLDWWSLKPLTKPALPSGAATHPIDRFIQAKLQEKGLQPSGVADARTILRRLTFDLIGLPPTADELAAFEKDAAQDLPAAIGRAADRLLASPRYGERWGATGSTWSTTATPTATIRTSSAPTPGPTAITSFAPSMTTSLTPASSKNSSPGTRSTRTPWTAMSPRASSRPALGLYRARRTPGDQTRRQDRPCPRPRRHGLEYDRRLPRHDRPVRPLS